MGGLYVRRGVKVVGPVEIDKLKELAATGKVLATDELSRDAAGPWSRAGAQPWLFDVRSPESAPNSLQAAQRPQSTTLAPTASDPDEPPPTWVEEPATALLHVGQAAAKRGGKVVVIVAKATAVGGRVMTTATLTVLRAMQARAERRHEIKLAKLKAKCEEAKLEYERQRLNPTPREAARYREPPPPQNIVIAPTFVQSTTTHVIQSVEQRGGCGCTSGCGGCLLILILVAIVVAVLAQVQVPSP